MQGGGLQLCWMVNTQSWCRCSRPASPGEGGGAWPFLNVHYTRRKKAAIVFVQFKKKRASEHDCSGAGADSLLSSSRHWVCRCLHLCMHPFVYAHQWGEGDLCSFDVSTDPRDKKIDLNNSEINSKDNPGVNSDAVMKELWGCNLLQHCFLPLKAQKTGLLDKLKSCSCTI